MGYLPLALSLVGGHLRHGSSVGYVLAELERTRLRLEPKDATALRPEERARGILRSSFEITWRLLERRLGDDAATLLAGLLRLGHAPATGFGRSLGAAMAGLDEHPFERLTSEAYGLSLVQIGRSARDTWMLHPLITEFLRSRSEGEAATLDGMTAWFVPRLREYEDGDVVREVLAEQDALEHWLARVPAKDQVMVERAGSRFAIQNGPFGAWRSFCATLAERCEADEDQSNALWTLANVALRAGDIELAWASATRKAALDEHRGNERGAALAFGVIGDILYARGELEQALKIRQDKQLPVYERLGDRRGLVVAQVMIGQLLVLRDTPGDRERAAELFRAALREAEAMGIPEAAQIRAVMKSANLA